MKAGSSPFSRAGERRSACYILVLTGSAVLGGLGSLLALGGLYVYEDLWVRAGQAVPLS